LKPIPTTKHTKKEREKKEGKGVKSDWWCERRKKEE
jgi:hypothetical protein